MHLRFPTLYILVYIYIYIYIYIYCTVYITLCDIYCTVYSYITQAHTLSVYSVLLHHSFTCCCLHSVHCALPHVLVVHSRPLLRVLWPVAPHTRQLVFKHDLSYSLSEACILSFSLCVLGRGRLRAWVLDHYNERVIGIRVALRVG